jgi:hypothetical protein
LRDKSIRQQVSTDLSSHTGLMFSGTDMDLSHKSHIYNDENEDNDDKDYNVQHVNNSAVERKHLSSWDSHLFCVCVYYLFF